MMGLILAHNVVNWSWKFLFRPPPFSMTSQKSVFALWAWFWFYFSNQILVRKLESEPVWKNRIRTRLILIFKIYIFLQVLNLECELNSPYSQWTIILTFFAILRTRSLNGKMTKWMCDPISNQAFTKTKISPPKTSIETTQHNKHINFFETHDIKCFQ
jgi:hypothetical protein